MTEPSTLFEQILSELLASNGRNDASLSDQWALMQLCLQNPVAFAQLFPSNLDSPAGALPTPDTEQETI